MLNVPVLIEIHDNTLFYDSLIKDAMHRPVHRIALKSKTSNGEFGPCTSGVNALAE